MAVDRVIMDSFTSRKTSERTGVPYQTLAHYIKRYKENEGAVDFKPTYKATVLDGRMEVEMFEYLKPSSKMNYGLTMKDVRTLAYDLAKANGLKMPANWEREKMAGRDWIFSFMKRHPLSLRKPEVAV